MEQARQKLQEVWGYSSFQGVQEKVIHRLLVENKSALVVMPTGGGKSLCFQLPALVRSDGLTLVISPLIALMKPLLHTLLQDQVDALKKLGVRAESWNSSLSMEELNSVRASLHSRQLKLLYVAPERLNNEVFVAMMKEQEISLLAVEYVASQARSETIIDGELYQRGSLRASFRPDYLKVQRFAKDVNAKRVLCLTATATPKVAKDTCEAFEIDFEKGYFTMGMYRSNLKLCIEPGLTGRDDKIDFIVPLLRSREGGAAIVYAMLQRDAQYISDSLNRQAPPIESRVYHAGLDADEREEVQNWFLQGQGVVVATIAQEIGRAGRDGLPAMALMLPSPNDMPLLEMFARSNTPSLTSIQRWLEDVRTTGPSINGALEISLYTQATRFDITQNTLGLLFAALEIHHGLLRAAQPVYTTYSFRPTEDTAGWEEMLRDTDPAALIIQKRWKFGRIWYNLAMVDTDEHRDIVAKKISEWELKGLCEMKVAGVQHRYWPTSKPFPATKEEINNLALQLFQNLSDREEADVERLQAIAAYVGGAECLSSKLFCTTGYRLHFPSGIAQPVNEFDVQNVLKICGVRDDARFLARVALGIRSPRVTALGLEKTRAWEACQGQSFGDLVHRFTVECEREGWINKAELAPPKTPRSSPTKRTAAPTPQAGSPSPSSRRRL
ncbi:hypothetical protein P7C70_g6238, partial [Phenoliferia sp. Uapishka_3]